MAHVPPTGTKCRPISQTGLRPQGRWSLMVAGTPNVLTSSQTIQRAFDRQSWSIHDVRINHRSLNILVAQNLLNRSDIGAVFEHMRRERMSKRMWRCRFFNSAQQQSTSHRLGKRAFVNMMAANRTASRIRRKLTGREDVLPLELPIRVRIFPG